MHITMVSDGIVMFSNGSHGFFVTPGGPTLKNVHCSTGTDVIRTYCRVYCTVHT